jgi:hypothetical protein
MAIAAMPATTLWAKRRQHHHCHYHREPHRRGQHGCWWDRCCLPWMMGGRYCHLYLCLPQQGPLHLKHLAVIRIMTSWMPPSRTCGEVGKAQNAP